MSGQEFIPQLRRLDAWFYVMRSGKGLSVDDAWRYDRLMWALTHRNRIVVEGR